MRSIAQNLPEDLECYSEINFIGYFGDEQKWEKVIWAGGVV